MDSQPSGNNKELIFIETDEIYFIIKMPSGLQSIKFTVRISLK